jgi:hypothetical protein
MSLVYDMDEKTMKQAIEFWLWGIFLIVLAFVLISTICIFGISINAEAAKTFVDEGGGWFQAIGVVIGMSFLSGLFVSFVLSIPYWIIMLIHWKFFSCEYEK